MEDEKTNKANYHTKAAQVIKTMEKNTVFEISI